MAAGKVENNPFECQEPLLRQSGRGVVVPRTEELQQALQLLQRGGFLAVSAPPRSGVTTFLCMLRDHLAASVYLDLANFAFAAEPSQAAAQALAREAAVLFPGLEPPAAPASVADVLSALNRSPAAAGSNLAVIVDGFDVLRDEVSCKLVLALRAAYTERQITQTGARRFSIVTGSAVDLRELTSFGRTSPLNIAQHIFLRDFNENEVREMFERGFGGAEDCYKWIAQAWRWTEGHPALAQLAGRQIFEEIRKKTDQAEARRRVLAALKEEAAEMLGSATELLSKRPGLLETAAQIYSGRPAPFERILRPIRELLHMGLIGAGGDGMARPRNAVFQQVLSASLQIPAQATTARLPENLRPSGSETGAKIQPLTPEPQAPAAGWASTTRSVTEAAFQESGGYGRDLADPPLLPPEMVIGGCQIIRRIGSGGMAEVYLARHLGLDTEVALKVLRQRAGQDRRIDQRFLREARAAAQLNHENIVQIRNVGRDGNVQFIEMEYLPGGPLSQLLGDPYCDFARAVGYIRGSAAGLEAAHAKGIIHRDIKPENLMLAADGRIKVVDFGLAAIVAPHISRLTHDGTIVGTPQYMAPEQWTGGKVDERSDIYSLGATFYHLFCGRPPFLGDTLLELTHNISTQTPPVLKELNAAIPAPLEHAIMQMLTREPAARYADIGAMLRDPLGLACLPQARKG